MLSTTTKTISAYALIPPHAVREQEKLEALVASMEADGWHGRPLLVVDDGQFRCLTGSHRVAAAFDVGIDVPCLVIETDDYEADQDAIEAILAASDDDDRREALRELPEAAALMEME